MWSYLLGPSIGGIVLERMNLRATVIARALIHLLNYIRERHEAEFSKEITQAGMAKALRTRRSHVSTTLSSLRKKGYIEHKLGRVVKELRRRKKVYFLTWKGYRRAIEIRDYYLRREVRVPFNGSLKTVRISELNDVLGEDYSLVDVLSCIDEAGVLDLEFLKKQCGSSEFEEPLMEHERRSIKDDRGAVAALHILL